MTNNRRVVKIFLASPGDLSEERKIAKAVVDEINEIHAEDYGYQVELVGWEDTVSVYGRPQATINRELERCELFLGLMWKRWGTQPNTTGPYSSGFEEEFMLSVRRRSSDGRPEISLLFKVVDAELLRDPGDELKKVLAFRNKLIEEKTLLFEDFTDSQDLGKKIRRCIYKFLQNLKHREIPGISDQIQAPIVITGKTKLMDINTMSSETRRSSARVTFIHDLISKIEQDAEQVPLSAVEVARFRLVANTLCTQGNDENSLGVHDANLLFAARESFPFDYNELTGLLVSGLEHYQNENTPLWHWLMMIERVTPQVLLLYSLRNSIYSAEVNVGALRAMRLTAEPISFHTAGNRQIYLNSWFADDAASALKIAALNYLGDFGIIADLPAIRTELEKNDYKTSSSAADAFIRINLRESREKAILALYDLQPASISKDVLSSLFRNGAVLSTGILLDGVGHQSPHVRRIVVELLCERGALPHATAEQLINDDDGKVRYEAVKFLTNNGRVFAGDEVKDIINKQVDNHRMGGLPTLLSGSDGQTYWEHFQQERLRTLSDKELEKALILEGIFDREPEFILAERHFKRRGDELRKAVDDQYKTKFFGALDTMTEKFRGESDLLKETRSLENYLCKKFTRRGLNIICSKGLPVDLARVRHALKSNFIEYAATDIDYLRKFGEWEDISLIINLMERPESSYNYPSEENYRVAARAIYVLGRKRLAEVLEMPAPAKLIFHLIIEISDMDFFSLDDLSISALLKSEDDAIRKIAAIKCIRALPKKRLSNLLDNYLRNQPRYYNVIHWLDFGVSISRNRTLQAVNRVLNQHTMNNT